MSNLDSLISRMGYDIEQQTRDMTRKANLSKSEWSGAARQQFDECHEELKANADQVQREIDQLKRVARALEASIQAADRDKALKAKAAAKT